jgi:hypothetical protein
MQAIGEGAQRTLGLADRGGKRRVGHEAWKVAEIGSSFKIQSRAV